jgi:hypothetical protein
MVQCVSLKVDCRTDSLLLRNMIITVFTRARHWTPFFQDLEDVLFGGHWHSKGVLPHHEGPSWTVILGHCFASGHSCTYVIPGHCCATVGSNNGRHRIPLLRSSGSNNGISGPIVTKTRQTDRRGRTHKMFFAHTLEREENLKIQSIIFYPVSLRFVLILLSSVRECPSWFQVSRSNSIHFSLPRCVLRMSSISSFLIYSS